jgi:uncharacterized protein
MLYSIVAEDSENSLEKRKSVRPEHLKRLEVLKQEGRLVLAGPFPAIDGVDPGPHGFTGSLIVAEFESLEQATLWANDDPYKKSGAFVAVVVKPFKQVF